MSRVRNSKLSFVPVISVAAAFFMLAAFAIAEHHESEPSVALAKSTYAPGEDIVVNFSNGPGNKDDWIAIYKAGEKPGSTFTRLWLYTDGTNATGEDGLSTEGVNAGEKSVSDGSVVLDGASDNVESTTVDWPLAEGDYDVYFFCCFHNDVLAGPVKLHIASDGD